MLLFFNLQVETDFLMTLLKQQAPSYPNLRLVRKVCCCLLFFVFSVSFVFLSMLYSIETENIGATPP